MKNAGEYKINTMGRALPSVKRLARRVAAQSLMQLGQQPVELTIKFVSRAEIRRLNCQFRQVDKVTDVLSFPAYQLKPGQMVQSSSQNLAYLGDMAICGTQTRKQAKDYGKSYKSEVQKLVIHSILHLMGYDHIVDYDYKIMHQKEEELEQKLSKK